MLYEHIDARRPSSVVIVRRPWPLVATLQFSATVLEYDL